MDETFLPWWMVVLLGMWATALTVWQNPGVNREWRFWAGLSTLVYLGLIFLALGAGFRPNGLVLPIIKQTQIASVGLALCVIVSLSAGVWFLGSVSLSSRQLSYVVLSLANAGVSAQMGTPEIAVGLCAVAIFSAIPLFRKWSRPNSVTSFRIWLTELTRFGFVRKRGQTLSGHRIFNDLRRPPEGQTPFSGKATPFNETLIPQDKSAGIWSVGVLIAILACMLLGTIAFSLRVETSRSTATHRFSTLPSRADLERLHSSGNDSARKSSLLSIVFGPRAEIIVLLGVIVFLCLAITLNEEPLQETARADLSNGSLPENPKLPAGKTSEGLA